MEKYSKKIYINYNNVLENNNTFFEIFNGYVCSKVVYSALPNKNIIFEAKLLIINIHKFMIKLMLNSTFVY